MGAFGARNCSGLLLALAVAVGWAAPAQSATINVSKAGTASDTPACGTAPAPDCATITYAIDTRAQPSGDTVAIAPGTYAEGGIATTKEVAVKGTGAGVVLAGDGNAAHTTLQLTVTSRVAVERVTFRSSVAQTAPELITRGPVAVSNVTFDSSHALSGDPGPIVPLFQADLRGTSDGAPSLANATFSSTVTMAAGAFLLAGTDAHRATGEAISTGFGYGNGAEVVWLDAADVTDLTTSYSSPVPAQNDNRGAVVMGSGSSLSDSQVTSTAAGVRLSSSSLLSNGAGTEFGLAQNVIDAGTSGVFAGSGVAQTVRDVGNRIRAPRGYNGANAGTWHLIVSHSVIDAPIFGITGKPAAGTVEVRQSYVTSVGGTTTNCTSSGSFGTDTSNCGLLSDGGAPGFVNRAAGDYHLLPGSPLIDAGIADDQAGPDLDGQPRNLDGDSDGVALSDAGVDEFVPTPDTQITGGPGTTVPGTVTFTFASPTAGASFTCALDGAAPVACNSGTYQAADVAAGDHAFSVTAAVLTNSDATPASTTFTLTAPATGNPPGGGTVPGGGTPPGGGGGPTPSGGGTSPGSSTPPRVTVLRLSALKLVRLPKRAGVVPAKAAVSVKASAAGRLRFELRRVLAKKRAKRVGKTKSVTVKKAGTVVVKLSRLTRKLKAGRYRVVITVGKKTTSSRIFSVRR